MNLFVEETNETGAFTFWADGDLQFDSRDEAVYHEALVLPALTLAQQSKTDHLRVLICGGGDGLALREALRFPGVTHVDLVDYSPEIVELGRTRFAELNQRAFNDARAHVHLADAWEFLANVTIPYDAVLCDFTTPRRAEDTRIMTRDWYARVAQSLAPHGVSCINGVSPQTTPEAFWCLRKTIRASGLRALPFRVCIPSFRDQGYGTWAFFLASHKTRERMDLRSLGACPISATQTDLSQLWSAASFTQAERMTEARVPVHTLDAPCLLPLLLNPGAKRAAGELPPLENLLAALPVLHPYHTRLMVETLAEQVIGSLKALDLRRLVDALLVRARDLPAALRSELTQLRDFLSTREAPRFAHWQMWAQRLFAVLVVIMTLANIVAPDNVYGKGTAGIGHASVSRGYSTGSFGKSGRSSFSRSSTSGYANSARTPGGSFGRPAVTSSRPTEPITGRGFRGGFQNRQPADIFGNSYRPRTFVYFHSGYYHGVGGRYDDTTAREKPIEQQARFVADDDMMVLDNGDVVVTLSDTAFLVVAGGEVTLHENGRPEPLFALYADPLLFENITTRLRDQKAGLQDEIKRRREWLGWVGWTRPLLSAVQSDQTELKALEDLDKRLDTALTRVGTSAKKDAPPDLPDNQSQGAVELFSSAGLLADGRVALIDAAGTYRFTNGKTITDGKTSTSCPPGLASALASVLTKLDKEFVADTTQMGSDLITLNSDKALLDKDLAEYTQLLAANGADYEVDYGTDTMTAQQAVERTNADLAQNAADRAEITKAQETQTGSVSRIRAAATEFAALAKSAAP